MLNPRTGKSKINKTDGKLPQTGSADSGKITFSLFLMLFLCLFLTSCGNTFNSQPTEEAEAAYVAGRKALYGLEGTQIDLKEAHTLFTEAAEGGKTEANFYLGLMCDWYYYPAKDYAQAKEYYEACKDYPYAKTALGYLYLYGNGTEEDIAKAEQLFNEAVKAGCVEGNAGLGALAYYNLEYENALQLFQTVMEEGTEQIFVTAAINNTGIMNYYGEGVNQSYEEAWEWYTKSANLGDSSAMLTLGNSFYHGEGVEQSYETAMEWYEKAIALGNADAMYTVGTMYSAGEGVEQDYVRSMEWFEKAANLGHLGSMSTLGFIYNEGLGVEQNYELAFHWFEKAAEAGDVNAMMHLSIIYENGLGVEENPEKAEEWYEKSGL